MARVLAYGQQQRTGQLVEAREAIPKDTKVSPRWYGPLLLGLLLLGVLIILLNYLSVFGTPSGWFLLLGLVVIGVGFALATRYRSRRTTPPTRHGPWPREIPGHGPCRDCGQF